MDTFAGAALVIKQNLIESLELPSFDKLTQKLDALDIDFYDYAASLEDFEEISHINSEEQEELDKLFAEFQKAFKARTSIDIFLSYHNSDSDFDEVQGAFFHLKFDDVFEPTLAAKNLQFGGLKLRLSLFSGFH